MPSFLHVNSGPRPKAETTLLFATDDWTEVRLDADPTAAPGAPGAITDLSAVPAMSVDALFCRGEMHRLPPEPFVGLLREFRRVLKPVGIAVFAYPEPTPPASMGPDLRGHPIVKLLERSGFVSIALRHTLQGELQVLASKGRRSNPVVTQMLKAHFGA